MHGSSASYNVTFLMSITVENKFGYTISLEKIITFKNRLNTTRDSTVQLRVIFLHLMGSVRSVLILHYIDFNVYRGETHDVEKPQ